MTLLRSRALFIPTLPSYGFCATPSRHSLDCTARPPPQRPPWRCTYTATIAAAPISCRSCHPHFQACPFLFSANPRKHTYHFLSFSVYSSGYRSLSHAEFPEPTVNMEQQEAEMIAELRELKQKIEAVGITCDESCELSHYNRLICPKCKGGQSIERSLSLRFFVDQGFAMWRCFRAKCGWSGQVFVGNRETYDGINQLSKAKSSKQTKEKSLELEPMGDKLIAYFAERMISKETLERNAVMQVSGGQNVVVFTYKRDGMLVGSKYRSIDRKKFWQDRSTRKMLGREQREQRGLDILEMDSKLLACPSLSHFTTALVILHFLPCSAKGTEKLLYGLDDIKEASEVIIVEGEVDKLSVEEAGFINCVSVPNGAPQKLSTKGLPSLEKDTAYQYLWNCKEYLEKASRIILATDGDTPGQALSEELARRLGKKRCWHVRWPKKDECSCYKDANEVLKNLGPEALRAVIENAELCTTPNEVFENAESFQSLPPLSRRVHPFFQL